MSPSNNAVRGMFTKHTVSVKLVKSLATGEKRYIPEIGEKQLLLSWNTRLRAETYGDTVAARCKRMARLINKQLLEKKERENV